MNARPQRTDKTQPRPYWPSVTTETLLDDVKLVRVLAAMDLRIRIATINRGDVARWQPTYLRHRSWASVAASSGAEWAGWSRAGMAGQWTDEVRAAWQAKDDINREHIARLNRVIRDSLVLVMARPKPVPPGMPRDYDCYMIDTRTGEWTGTCDVASQRGDDLISLGTVIWQCGFPQAAGRIARAAGFEIPRIIYG